MEISGVIGTIVACIIAYLIGSLNFSILISRWFGRDVRSFHSKNAGASNIGRVWGFKWASVVVVLDVCKLVLVMFCGWGISFMAWKAVKSPVFYFHTLSFYLPGLFCILGHCFPCWFKFKGGKGVVCFFALTFMVSPWTFLIFFVLFWGLNLSLKIISFGSIIATLATIVIIWVMPLYQVTNLTSTSQPLANKYLWFNQLHAMTIANYGDSLLMIALTVTGSGMIVIGKHYQNLIRLFRCQEQKYHFQTTTATK